MNRHKFLSLLLALTLSFSLLVLPAAAAGGPRLVLSSAGEGTTQTVGFAGLPDDCQSLQVTLTMSQAGAGYDFAPDSSLDRAGVYATCRQDGADVTIYVTARSGSLPQGGALTLGVLSTADTLFTVESAGGLKLLDSSDGETTYDAVSQSGATGGVTTWPVSIKAADGGQVTASAARAAAGRTVTLTAAPDSGYTLSSLTAVTSAGQAVALTSQGDGKYTFVMPAASVAVTPVFAPEQSGDAGSLPFADVAPGSWYYDAVAYVYEQGLMGGTAGGRFSPDVTTSRAMIVTILYRQAGSPAAAGGAAFSDVAAGSWYADAVAWASANGIVTGYGSGAFGPDDPITREQMAAILYRYAAFQGRDVSGQASLDRFSDAGRVASYAAGAVRWAVDAGLITGTTSTTLSPSGSATRAQAATILSRFCQSLTA